MSKHQELYLAPSWKLTQGDTEDKWVFNLFYWTPPKLKNGVLVNDDDEEEEDVDLSKLQPNTGSTIKQIEEERQTENEVDEEDLWEELAKQRKANLKKNNMNQKVIKSIDDGDGDDDDDDDDGDDGEKETSQKKSNKNMFSNFLQSTGLWTDYSGPDRSFRTVTGEGDDKKTKYDWKAGFENTVGNLSKYAGIGMSFLKDPEMADNEINDIATSTRKTAQKAMMQSGNPYVMLAAAVSMGSDKADATASASKGLGTWNDIGNFAASQVPFLGLLAKKTDKKFETDALKGSSMYNWKSVADGLYNGRILLGDASGVTKYNNMLRASADTILTKAKLNFVGANDPRYYYAAQNELNGGYDLVGLGKNGTVLLFTKRIVSKRNIVKKKNGGRVLDNTDKPVVKQTKDGNFEIYLDKTLPYEEWVKSIPQDYIGEDTYDLELLYNTAIAERDAGNPELWDLLQRWVYAITRPTLEERDFYLDMLLPDENGKMYYPYHTGSIIEEVDENGNRTGNYIFLKLGLRNENPELKGKLEWFNSEEGKEFRDKYYLDSINGRYYYRRKDPEKFKEGGKVNVIPEGALHKNKHHLEDVDDKFEGGSITTKGIPVIVESEGGEVILQAEVERQEIIFRLEVTKKLEELAKENTDKAAIEAGKLLVKEILYNTKDNTGEMI